jgi:hypothetical protein
MARRRFFYLFVVLLLVSTVVLVSGMFLHARQATVNYSRTDDLLELEAETLLNDPHYSQQFIRTGPPEILYNCHGWTFAHGSRAIPDEEVYSILRSGRYRKVTTPMPDDIVIYYEKSGDLCHSGIVKATGRQGFVLVESKWGSAGRFLHLLDLPEVQVKHEFYRPTNPASRKTRSPQ